MAAGARRDARRQAAAAHSRLGRADRRRRASGRDDDRKPGRLQREGAAGARLAAGLRLLAAGLRRGDCVRRLNRKVLWTNRSAWTGTEVDQPPRVKDMGGNWR